MGSKEVPQPQLREALGLSTLKPESLIASQCKGRRPHSHAGGHKSEGVRGRGGGGCACCDRLGGGKPRRWEGHDGTCAGSALIVFLYSPGDHQILHCPPTLPSSV